MVDEIKENEEKESITSQSNEELNKDNSGDNGVEKDLNTNNDEFDDKDMEENKAKNDQNDKNNEDIEKNLKSEEGLNSLELLKTIVKLEEEKESSINSLQRMKADFSNYRKRTDKEMGKVQSTTVVELIRELLPVIDNFERALDHDESDDDFRKGVEMIYRQFMTFLEKQGVEVIDAIGEDFDHNYHHAVMQVEAEDAESGVIIEELQKGYILGDIVIRPAMVKVVE